jgi:hypothetical protein
MWFTLVAKMVNVNMKSIFIFSAFVFAFVHCSAYDWEKIISQRKQNAGEKHWALIIAGSSGWYNYRHQVRRPMLHFAAFSVFACLLF